MDLQILVSRESRPYHGPELRPHFLLSQMKLKGSAIAAFVGPCEVKTESMVDWEDRLANDFIRSKLMLHFLGEFFGASLREGVLLQRLLVAIAREEIEVWGGEARRAERLKRDGDDLFWGDRKLSVSIVTASPVSQLLHLGVNVDATGAPVNAGGLQDWNPDTKQDPGRIYELAERILKRFQDELRSIEWACAKVRPVF